jgi:hypothetical protein
MKQKLERQRDAHRSLRCSGGTRQSVHRVFAGQTVIVPHVVYTSFFTTRQEVLE